MKIQVLHARVRCSDPREDGKHLDPLLADGELIEAEDGALDDVDGRQDGQTDVDGVTPLWIQNQNL